MREIAQQFAVRLDLLDQAMTAIGQHALLDLARLDQHGPALARQPDGRDRHFHRFHGAAQERQLPDVGIAPPAAIDGGLYVLGAVEQRGGRLPAQLLRDRPNRSSAAALAYSMWPRPFTRKTDVASRSRASTFISLPIALRATRNARNQHNSIENAAEPAKPAR